MKKLVKKNKLVLSRETLKILAGTELNKAIGGGGSVGDWWTTCTCIQQ